MEIIKKEITCFDDLVFGAHLNGREGNVQAMHELPNGITISVVGGYGLYGDGIESFEVAAFRKESKDWIPLSEYDDVVGWRSKDEVTEIIQSLLMS
jgi:hypothetical protein